MAFTKTPKLFLGDLSNYAEIRRGLSKAVREQTPTLKQLRSVDSATQQGLINALNDWRLSGQAQKKSAAGMQQGIVSILSDAAQSGYMSPAEQIRAQTAAFRLRSMDPKRAEWEVREIWNSLGRLRDQDFYKAKYYLDDDTFNEKLATVDMLETVLNEGPWLSQYGEDVVRKITREYYKRTHPWRPKDLSPEDEEEYTILKFSSLGKNNLYYEDVNAMVKVILGH